MGGHALAIGGHRQRGTRIGTLLEVPFPLGFLVASQLQDSQRRRDFPCLSGCIHADFIKCAGQEVLVMRARGWRSTGMAALVTAPGESVTLCVLSFVASRIYETALQPVAPDSVSKLTQPLAVPCAGGVLLPGAMSTSVLVVANGDVPVIPIPM